MRGPAAAVPAGFGKLGLVSCIHMNAYWYRLGWMAVCWMFSAVWCIVHRAGSGECCYSSLYEQITICGFLTKADLDIELITVFCNP